MVKTLTCTSCLNGVKTFLLTKLEKKTKQTNKKFKFFSWHVNLLQHVVTKM